MDIAIIRRRVEAGNYFVRSHAVVHALKEGFAGKDMVEAVLRGRIIEEYSDASRALVCGKTNLTQITAVYLHVVCELVDPIYVDFVTAYVPDGLLWEVPPYRRRSHRRG